MGKQASKARIVHVATSRLDATLAARHSRARETNRVDVVICILTAVGIRSEASNGSHSCGDHAIPRHGPSAMPRCSKFGAAGRQEVVSPDPMIDGSLSASAAGAKIGGNNVSDDANPVFDVRWPGTSRQWHACWAPLGPDRARGSARLASNTVVRWEGFPQSHRARKTRRPRTPPLVDDAAVQSQS